MLSIYSDTGHTNTSFDTIETQDDCDRGDITYIESPCGTGRASTSGMKSNNSDIIQCSSRKSSLEETKFSVEEEWTLNLVGGIYIGAEAFHPLI